MKRALGLAVISMLFPAVPSLGGSGDRDTDLDQIFDSQDNCVERPNSQQVDTDGDFCGNACDADYDNDGIVGFLDFAQFGLAFGKSTDLEKDHTEPNTGPVGFGDFAVFGQRFGKPPGPSGTSPGTIACPTF